VYFCDLLTWPSSARILGRSAAGLIRRCALVLWSADRQRIDWRTDGAGDRQSRTDEHEVIHFVAGAGFRQFVELEDFAHGQAHDRNTDPVPGLVGVVAIVGTHFDAPGIGR